MTDEQMDDLMTLAVNMQREAEADCNRPSAMFAYAVQVAVLEIRETRCKYEELQSQNADLAVQLANAESKCRELAAELSAVDKIHNEAVFITDDHYEQCPPEVQKMIRSLAVLQIPACDTFLAEVRAQGVEMLKEHVNKWMHDMNLPADTQFEHSEFVGTCDEFAAQLRKGVEL